MNPSSLPHPLSPPFSPDALDALSELTTTISLVRAALESSPSTGQAAESTPGAAAATATNGLLSKDVPTATDGLKHKLQRARLQLRALPDMSRTIAEQTEEIRELENRIQKQRAVLAYLRAIGGLAGEDRMET